MSQYLYAGAAKQSINPLEELFPLPQREWTYYNHSKENIYVRSVACKVDGNLYLLLSFELFGLPFYEKLRNELSSLYEIPKSHIICCDTYNHCAPREDLQRYPVDHCGSDVQERTNKYFEYCTDIAIHATELAVATMRRVCISISSGHSSICHNRDEKIGDKYIMGKNPNAPCNRKYTIIRLTDFENNHSVATLLHYSLYGNMCYLASPDGGKSLGVNGDFPGSVCSAIETLSSAPTLWLCGAAGNQNPLLLSSYINWCNNQQIILTEKQTMDIREYQMQWLLGDILHATNQTEYQTLSCFSCASETLELPRIDIPDQMVTITLTVVRIDEFWMVFISGAPVCELGNKIISLFPNENALLITHAGPFTGYLIPYEDADKKTFAALNMVISPGLYEKRVFPVLQNLIQKLQNSIN